MEEPQHAAPATPEDLISSYLENTNYTFNGFEEADARRIAENLAVILREIGKIIDISRLDGVTVGRDYDQALASLDRGYASNHVLTRTTDVATGIAMTPSVLRDGELKSHIVIDGGYATFASGEDEEMFNMLLHTLAHECAHVEITTAWDRCFPGELLRTTYDSLLVAWRGQVVSACWDEYAATRIAGTIGYDPLDGYAETFLTVLGSVDDKIAALVRNFEGGSAQATNDFTGSVYGAFGDLMKFACYLLGNLAALDRMGRPVEKVETALGESWFGPYYSRLEDACAGLYSEFGRWDDKAGFDVIADILQDIVEERVMNVWERDDGTYTIRVHHSAAR